MAKNMAVIDTVPKFMEYIGSNVYSSSQPIDILKLKTAIATTNSNTTKFHASYALAKYILKDVKMGVSDRKQFHIQLKQLAKDQDERLKPLIESETNELIRAAYIAAHPNNIPNQYIDEMRQFYDPDQNRYIPKLLHCMLLCLAHFEATPAMSKLAQQQLDEYFAFINSFNRPVCSAVYNALCRPALKMYANTFIPKYQIAEFLVRNVSKQQMEQYIHTLVNYKSPTSKVHFGMAYASVKKLKFKTIMTETSTYVLTSGKTPQIFDVFVWDRHHLNNLSWADRLKQYKGEYECIELLSVAGEDVAALRATSDIYYEDVKFGMKEIKCFGRIMETKNAKRKRN